MCEPLESEGKSDPLILIHWVKDFPESFMFFSLIQDFRFHFLFFTHQGVKGGGLGSHF